MENTTGEQQQKEEEDSEYESDPEELKMSLKMRRREASDDEDIDDDDDDDDDDNDNNNKAASISAVDFDGESDGQGGAAEYDDGDDNDDDDEEYYDDDEQEVFDDDDEEGVERKGVGDDEVAAREVVVVVKEGGESRGAVEEGEGGGGGEGEEKKENEPFAVPTSGAFYMHDDRFRDNNAPPGRHRRTFGGRKLWESKDDRKWGHDKFEEMNLRDRHYEEGRKSSRGSYIGRGKTRGTNRGYARGGRMKGYSGNNNQGVPPKDVRGRGPRRYQPSMKNRRETVSQNNRQSGKSLDKVSHTGPGRVASTTSSLNVELEQVPAKKVASSLNSASPPFYPSGSSSKDTALTQKKEVQAGNHNRNIRTSAVDHNFSVSHSNNLIRGKNVVDSMGMDKLHIDDSVSPPTGKPLNSVHMLPSASMSVGTAPVTQSRAQGRGVIPSGSASFQPLTNNQINKVSSSVAQPSQRIPVQTRGQSSQQLVQRPLDGSQTSAPAISGLPVAAFEPGNFESPLESGKSKVVTGKGKGSAQGTGRDAIVYGGAQVMGPGGNVSSGHADPNLPAFFPVMQFGGQHPGGIPAVGMAFPGYVAQPNGVGSSEMTWLPVLSGALGGSYCPPYLSVDGSYNPRPTGQSSALPAPSKENHLRKSSNELKPLLRSDVVNDEFSHRQNKPRRYSEMKFSQ